MEQDLGQALEVEHLTIGFGTTLIVRDLSFTVRRGSTLAIIGPNGAGKTVLVRCTDRRAAL